MSAASPVVGIHQPNFFPWLGYFAKIAASDTFVLLDDVEYSHGTYTNRVQLWVNGQARWQTCPRRHPGAPTAIWAIQIAEDQPWRKKLLKTLQAAYGRTEHAEEMLAFLAELLQQGGPSLGDFNGRCIRAISSQLGLKTRLVTQRELMPEGPGERRGSELLVELCIRLDAAAYLAGDGAQGYEETARYAAAGLGHRCLGYRHPRYPQGSQEFRAGLSVLDALFHVGWSGTRGLLATPDEG